MCMQTSDFSTRSGGKEEVEENEGLIGDGILIRNCVTVILRCTQKRMLNDKKLT